MTFHGVGMDISGTTGTHFKFIDYRTTDWVADHVNSSPPKYKKSKKGHGNIVVKS